MLRFYKTLDGQMLQIPEEQSGCWIRVLDPTVQETEYLIHDLGLDSGFVTSSLDEEETSRIEQEGNQTFVVVDFPYRSVDEEGTVSYTTIPLGIIITPDYFVTIGSTSTDIIDNIASGHVKGVRTQYRTRFLLTILLRIAQRFLVYLKQIDRLSDDIQSQLNDSAKNEALIQILGLEKSLVYFSSSLRANETTLKKITRGRLLTLYEEDEDLMEDTMIEFNQAIEMTGTYSHILNSTMEAYANIINNNMNVVMKVLTSVTILMTIPTMVFSYYGMNVSGLHLPVWWFPLSLSVLSAVVALIVLVKLKMFK